MTPREPHKRMLRAALGIIALCLVGLIVTAQQEPVTELCSMSLLLNTRQEVDWSALCAGAQVAANEHDVDLSIVTLSADNDAGEQASLLERETARGAQAILLCAADREALAAPVERCGVPVVTVSTGLDGDAAALALAPDHYALGQLLGNAIITQHPGGHTVLLAVSADGSRSGLQRTEMRVNGLRDALAASGYELRQALVYEEDFASPDALRARLGYLDASAIVSTELPLFALLSSTLDPDALALYGFDVNTGALRALDDGRAAGLAVSDDFSLGYLAVTQARGLLEKKRPTEEPALRQFFVSRDNMYDATIQWLLFPLSD